MATIWRDANRILSRIPKRAEQRQIDQLRETFVDSGVGMALDVIDHQVLYGRRGTGKTHAMRYLESVRRATGDIPVYVDLRMAGSPESLFLGQPIDPVERAARIFVDLMSHVHEGLLSAALEDDELIADRRFVAKLDALLDSLAEVRVVGQIEKSNEAEMHTTEGSNISASIGTNPGALSAGLGVSSVGEVRHRDSHKVVRKGSERRDINFGDVAKALRAVSEALGKRRLWLLLDEWIALPLEVQPYLGEFLIRCVYPLQGFTVKIAAIEQQARFRSELDDGSLIGIELGADATANLDLDEFMVFEQNEEEARSFFRRLIFNHLQAGGEEDGVDAGVNRESEVVSHCFTDVRAFDELVRAAEGVPRDAINVLGTAAQYAKDRKVSVPDVRRAALNWFQRDKAGALTGRDDAVALLHWVVDEVIKGKRARGFLVNQKDASAALLMALFDARVLHLARRGYSAQDEPGERYNVYVIDYGAYVDLMQTKFAPQGVLPVFDEEDREVGFVEVPTQDLRSLRRAILKLGEFRPDRATPS